MRLMFETRNACNGIVDAEGRHQAVAWQRKLINHLAMGGYHISATNVAETITRHSHILGIIASANHIVRVVSHARSHCPTLDVVANERTHGYVAVFAVPLHGGKDIQALVFAIVKRHMLGEQLPIYDFATEQRAAAVEPIDLQGGVCIVEGIHALNPELTGLVPAEDVYRIYAGLREEYAIDGRRVINTQDIRLCRRTLRDAAARGRSPEKTLAMWDRVLDGETRYIKGFKTTADFLLDTSFTYELGLISRLLGIVRRQFTLEGHNAELWDETARRFEHVAPLSLDLLPPDSMLREFYGGKV